MTNTKELPTYIRLTIIALGILIWGYILVVGQLVIVPILYATLFAILLNPMVGFLSAKGIKPLFAITITMVIALGLLAGLCYLLVSQFQVLSDTFPHFQEKFFLLSHSTIDWLALRLNLSAGQINGWLANLRTQAMANSGIYLTQTVSTLGVFVAGLVIIPVYIFMLLYYQPLLMDFIRQLFSKVHHAPVVDIMKQVRAAVQSYLRGLMIESVIVATLNVIALLLIGVDYAVLLGIIGGVLNIIPYLGGMAAVGLPMIVALVNQDVFHMLLVLGAYSLIQFIDNNYLLPKVVASKVQVNALISVVGVIIAGALWGIAGMFLSIPLLAVIKIVCDHIEELKPWGFLLGDTMPKPTVVDTFLHTPKQRTKAHKHTA
jgi:predicted PurR-regulated permease PerM